MCESLKRVTTYPPPYPDLRGSERQTLEQFLDLYRRVVLAHLEGPEDHQAAKRVIPSTDLTIGGIVKHLAMVEDLWFQKKLLGRDMPEPWRSAPMEEPDWDFHSARDDSTEELRLLYEQACDRSRSALASFESLDATSERTVFNVGHVSVRWILVHMIEETARHAGHADLIREALEAESPL